MQNILEHIDLGKLHKDAVKVAAEVDNGLQSLLHLLVVTPLLVVLLFLTLRYDILPSWEISKAWIDSLVLKSPSLTGIATAVVFAFTLAPGAAQFLGKKMAKLPLWVGLIITTFIFDFLGDGYAIDRDLDGLKMLWVGAINPTTEQITSHLVGYIGYTLVWFTLTALASVVSEAITVVCMFLFVAFFTKSIGYWILRLRRPKKHEKKPEQPKVVNPDGKEVHDERFREAREVPPFNREQFNRQNNHQGKRK